MASRGAIAIQAEQVQQELVSLVREIGEQMDIQSIADILDAPIPRLSQPELAVLESQQRTIQVLRRVQNKLTVLLQERDELRTQLDTFLTPENSPEIPENSPESEESSKKRKR